MPKYSCSHPASRSQVSQLCDQYMLCVKCLLQSLLNRLTSSDRALIDLGVFFFFNLLEYGSGNFFLFVSRKHVIYFLTQNKKIASIENTCHAYGTFEAFLILSIQRKIPQKKFASHTNQSFFFLFMLCFLSSFLFSFMSVKQNKIKILHKDKYYLVIVTLSTLVLL